MEGFSAFSFSGVADVAMSFKAGVDVTSLIDARELADGMFLMKLEIDSVSDFWRLWDAGVIGDGMSSGTSMLQHAKLLNI